MRKVLTLSVLCFAIFASCEKASDSKMESVGLNDVKVVDSFWSARLDQWRTVTINCVMDKFDGKDIPENIASQWPFLDVIHNFDRVAAGERNCGEHSGFPWYDGLVYETIRAAADFLKQAPDPALEARVDAWVKRIAAAQEEDGYINTYTQLIENEHRWGENGGKLRWQHDIYNAGALVDAGVHYYNATGKRELLDVAIKMADLICDYIGWAPKHDIVPGHALSEEAFVSLYELTGEQKYLDMTKFWIDARGTGHPGIDSEYAQDRIPVRELTALEGHAVRASLLMDGVTDYTRVSGDTTYYATCQRLWDNMAGRKMLLTGAIGSVADDEKFGADYYLPVDAYAETCAGVGLAFYSHQMHLLDRDAKYVDELERSIYNNILGGIGASGTEFTYVNPLNADNVGRWKWHLCPCCPPMFLKLVSALPSMIYSTCGDDLFVNLYIGSEAKVSDNLSVSMDDGYMKGEVRLTMHPCKASKFTLNLRIPGWSVSKENPFGLYVSSVSTEPSISVNGKAVAAEISQGYAVVNRKWKEGDEVVITFPIEPRFVTANDKTGMSGKAAISVGPFVYCLEGIDNPELDSVAIGGDMSLIDGGAYTYGLPLVKGEGFIAVPSFCIGNRSERTSYRIWADSRQQ